MIQALLLVCFFAPALFSQVVGGIAPFPPDLFPLGLKQYLELTDAQVSAITQLNSGFQTMQLEKARRTSQVYLELSQETARTPIDPMALGVRHAELEAIRRELEAEQSKLAARIHDALTPAQKIKLQSLEQARQLQPVICEAQAVNLLSQRQLPSSQISPNPFFGTVAPPTCWFDTAAFLVPTVACGPGLRGGIVRDPFPVARPQP